MGNNITPISFPQLSGDDDGSRAKFLYEIYAYGCQRADQIVHWYLGKKAYKRILAKTLRFLAIGLTTIGSLVPLMMAARILPGYMPGTDGANPASPLAGVDYGQCGYIALALAGACVALDKFFGYSSAWMRCLTTSLRIQRLKEEFNIEWAILRSSGKLEACTQAEIELLLKRTQVFLGVIMGEVEAETATWATEYKNSITELEKNARLQLETNKPGVINLQVKNAGGIPEGVTVLLDEMPRQTITTSEAQLSPVFPGDHFVRISAALNGKSLTAGAPVRVEPGQSVSLTLSLPVSQN